MSDSPNDRAIKGVYWATQAAKEEFNNAQQDGFTLENLGATTQYLVASVLEIKKYLGIPELQDEGDTK